MGNNLEGKFTETIQPIESFEIDRMLVKGFVELAGNINPEHFITGKQQCYALGNKIIEYANCLPKDERKSFIAGAYLVYESFRAQVEDPHPINICVKNLTE